MPVFNLPKKCLSVSSQTSSPELSLSDSSWTQTLSYDLLMIWWSPSNTAVFTAPAQATRCMGPNSAIVVVATFWASRSLSFIRHHATIVDVPVVALAWPAGLLLLNSTTEGASWWPIAWFVAPVVIVPSLCRGRQWANSWLLNCASTAIALKHLSFISYPRHEPMRELNTDGIVCAVRSWLLFLTSYENLSIFRQLRQIQIEVVLPASGSHVEFAL